MRDTGALFTQVIFTAIAALFFGSILAMSAMNALQAPTTYLPMAFLAGAIAGAILFRAAAISVPTLSPRDHAIVWAVTLVLGLPRLPYLFEPLLGVAVNAVCWDDWFRIQQLSSLAYSPDYPARSSFDPDMFLGFYYAPWLMGAAGRVAGLAATLKPLIALNHLILILSACYVAVAAARVLFTDTTRRRVFLVLLFLFGGFDGFPGILHGLLSLFTGDLNPLLASEWWPTGFFLQLHYPDFTSLALWTPHHLSAAAALVMALHIYTRAPGTARAVLAGGLGTYALFSSAFVCLGATPFVITLMFRHGIRPGQFLTALATLTALSLPLLWIYLNRESAIGFALFGALIGPLADLRALGLAVFVIVLGLEFLPLWILILAPDARARRRAADRWLLGLAVLFLMSTFVIAFGGTSNNYAGRGSIFSILVLIYLAAQSTDGPLLQQFRLPTLRLVTVLYLCGSGLAWLAFSAEAARQVADSFTPFHRAALLSNRAAPDPVDPETLEQAGGTPYGWYLLESPKPVPKPDLDLADRELLNPGPSWRRASDTGAE